MRKTIKTRNAALPVAVTGNEIAHRALAWDHMQHGEFEDAAEELGDAAALNRSDMWIRYYFSVLKYRMAQAKHTDIPGTAQHDAGSARRARMVSRIRRCL